MATLAAPVDEGATNSLEFLTCAPHDFDETWDFRTSHLYPERPSRHSSGASSHFVQNAIHNDRHSVYVYSLLCNLISIERISMTSYIA